MFEGLRTVVYHVDDLARAKSWWNEVLGFGPYFDEPFYVGYNVGGYELGLHPGAESSAGKAVGVITYWGVKDIEDVFGKLIELGGTRHEAVQEVGGGIKVASVIDPFGNAVGIIENPHFSLPAAK